MKKLFPLFAHSPFQNHPDGSPSVDMAHVVDCLNKLDAGVDERVMLMSRDEQSVLIVRFPVQEFCIPFSYNRHLFSLSYKDLHNCVQSAFSELFSSSVEAVDRLVAKNIGGPGMM
jgi:PAB-dependent poly(A)-specific ribonuclease subunit 3